MSINKLKDFIVVVKKAVPAALCDGILNEYNDCDDWEDALAGRKGGEFAFFDRQLKYKLNKGDALMFPSNFMYPHEVMEVTEGTRYAIITWFR